MDFSIAFWLDIQVIFVEEKERKRGERKRGEKKGEKGKNENGKEKKTENKVWWAKK